MQFLLMRFMMAPRGSTSATREGWLRDTFGEEIRFLHSGIDFHFVPNPELKEPAIMVGRVGRRVIAVENQPPEAHFAETEHEAWRAALVLIDPRAHENGQMVAVETLPEVGRPLAIMSSLAYSVNLRVPQEVYFLEVNAITDLQTFQDFERENRGHIVDITFDLHVPNMFGIRDD